MLEKDNKSHTNAKKIDNINEVEESKLFNEKIIESNAEPSRKKYH